MNTKENNNLSELNNILFTTLRGVEQGTVDEKKAQTIANLGNTIISNAKTQLQGYKLTGGRTSITALPSNTEEPGKEVKKIELPKHTYDRQMMYVEEIGYKSPADAISKLGKHEFLKQFHAWEKEYETKN